MKWISWSKDRASAHSKILKASDKKQQHAFSATADAVLEEPNESIGKSELPLWMF